MKYNKFVKVVVEEDRIDPSTKPGAITETMWAAPVGGGMYELRNVPFFIYGLAEGDIVEAIPNIKYPEIVEFIATRKRGGHSAVRVVVRDTADAEMVRSQFGALRLLGCSYEEYGKGTNLYAWDIPPEADIDAVLDIFGGGEEAALWEYEDVHIGHDID